MDKFDEASVRYLAQVLWTDDRRKQKEAVQQYYTEDVHFMAEVAEGWGRASVYQGTRGLNFLLGLNGVYDVKEVIISKEGNKAVLVGDAAYTHGLGPFSYRYPVPLVVVLHARQEADGKWRVHEHVENHSFYLLYTVVLGDIGKKLFHSVVGPVGAALLGGAGMLGDVAVAARERLMEVASQVLKDFV